MNAAGREPSGDYLGSPASPGGGREALAVRRLRAGALLYAVVSLAITAAEWQIAGTQKGLLAVSVSGGVATCAVAGLVTLLPWGRRHTVTVAALAAIALDVFLSMEMVARNPLHQAVLLVPLIVCLMTGTALVLPWGARYQGVVCAVCIANFLGLWAGGLVALSAPELVDSFAVLVGSAVVAIFGAGLIERSRRELEARAAALDAANRRLREADQVKNDFLGAVSHELRTPMNVIIGYADLLLEEGLGKLAPPQRHALERIAASGRDLLAHVSDLLDLTRLGAGKLRVTLDTVRLAPIFAELEVLAGILLRDRPVRFRGNLADENLAVRADPLRLKQVLSNLLVNASKFTERGEIRLQAAPDGNGHVRIAVEDTGIGIRPEHHKLVFEPFRQVGPDSEGKRGAGLGLPLSAKLVELMGGKLELASTPGKGSRFSLLLPAASLTRIDRA